MSEKKEGKKGIEKENIVSQFYHRPSTCEDRRQRRRRLKHFVNVTKDRISIYTNIYIHFFFRSERNKSIRCHASPGTETYYLKPKTGTSK